jgi:hypothetical protein
MLELRAVSTHSRRPSNMHNLIVASTPVSSKSISDVAYSVDVLKFGR